MIILLIILVCIAIIVCLGYEIDSLVEEGSPPKDKDVLEMLEKKGHLYTKYGLSWDKNKYIASNYQNPIPSIWKFKVGIIFPYYINGVGCLPIWYKSTRKIDKLFKELEKNSIHHNKKRKNLGLD